MDDKLLRALGQGSRFDISKKNLIETLPALANGMHYSIVRLRCLQRALSQKISWIATVAITVRVVFNRTVEVTFCGICHVLLKTKETPTKRHLSHILYR